MHYHWVEFEERSRWPPVQDGYPRMCSHGRAAHEKEGRTVAEMNVVFKSTGHKWAGSVASRYS